MGEFLGQLIIIFYILTISSFILVRINKNFKEYLIKNDKFYTLFKKVLKLIRKYHSLFGILTIVFLLLHFTVQFISRGLNLTGMLAASLLILQVMLGIYGKTFKKKFKNWIAIHRIIAVVLLIAILIHIA